MDELQKELLRLARDVCELYKDDVPEIAECFSVRNMTEEEIAADKANGVFVEGIKPEIHSFKPTEKALCKARLLVRNDYNTLHGTEKY